MGVLLHETVFVCVCMYMLCVTSQKRDSQTDRQTVRERERNGRGRERGCVKREGYSV